MRKPARTVQYHRFSSDLYDGHTDYSEVSPRENNPGNHVFHLQGSFNPEVFHFINEHMV